MPVYNIPPERVEGEQHDTPRKRATTKLSPYLALTQQSGTAGRDTTRDRNNKERGEKTVNLSKSDHSCGQCRQLGKKVGN